jgi:spore germination protein PE
MNRINDQSLNTYHVRTATVGFLRIISVAQAGIVQLGDRAETKAKLRALAVQRKEDHLTAGEVYFEAYEIFSRPLPILIDSEFDNAQGIELFRTNCAPNITVGYIQVIASGSAASIQIGNGVNLNAESRIKHIRQFPNQNSAPSLGG